MKTFTTCAEKKAKQFLNLLQGYTKGIRMTAILILLLMGVSNAWASNGTEGTSITVYTSGELFGSAWDASKSYIKIHVRRGDNDWMNYATMTETGKTYNGKKIYSYTFKEKWDGAQIYFEHWKTGSGSRISEYGTDWANTSTLNGKLYLGYMDNGHRWATLCYDATIYFLKNGKASSWTTLKAHAWNEGYSSVTTTWPGTEMTNTDKTYDGNPIYSVTFSNPPYSKVIFNQGNGTNQSGEQTIPDHEGKIFDYEANKWIDYTYDVTVTFKANGGTGNDYTQTVKYNTATALTANKFTRAGYSFNGWKTAANSGTSYANQASVKFTANTTLYAQWTANQYTITYKDQGNVTFTGEHASGYPTKHTYGTATTLSTATKTGYTFGGWHTDAACTQKVTSLGATAYTANITLYAKWTLNATYSLNVVAGNGISQVAGSKDPVTLGNTYDIKATPKTGYTFSTWTANPAANAEFADARSENTTVTVKNGSVTVTANAEEIKHAVQVNIETGQEAWGELSTNSVEVGQITKSTTITATPKTAVGYEFDHWEISDGITIVDGTENSTEITIKATKAGSLTAHFRGVNRLQNVFLIGTMNDWKESDADWQFYKLPGESGNTVTLTKTIIKSDYHAEGYKFGVNIYQAGWNDKWWHNSAENDTKMDAHNCTGWVFGTKDGDKKTFIDLNVSGEYTFTLAHSGTYNQQALSITYPDKSFIEGAFELAWNEEAYKLTENGNIQSVTIQLAAKSSVEFRLVSHGKLFGTSTKITRAANSQTLTAKNMEDAGATMKFDADYAGNYEFQYNKETKKLTVIYPTIYTVNYSRVPESAADAPTTSPSVTSGNSVVAGTSVTFTAQDAKTGYTWKGWYDNNSGTGEALSTDKVYTRSITANTTIYAVYTAKTSKVTLNPQPGEGGTTSVDATAGSAMPDIEIPTRHGYTFGGYYDQESGNGTQYYNERGKSAKDWDKEGDVTLYAKWTATPYTITYNTNGGNAIANGSYTIEEAFILPTPTKIGSTFEGWFDNSELTGEAITTIASGSTGDKEFWAKWNIGTYAVTLDMEGGNGGTASVNVAYGAAMPTITIPTKNDHLFDGYYDGDNGTGTKYYNADGTSAKNWDKETATLYAKWIPYSQCIFFKNTLSWSDVYVYTFTDNAYWNDGTGVHPSTNKLEQGKMTQLDKTDIYYYILTDLTGFSNIAFSDYDMRDYGFFNDHKAIYRSDRSDLMPLFIPQKDQTPTGDTYTTNKYYSSGIWMKYNSTESGYKWSSDKNGWSTDVNPFTASAKGGYTFTTTVTLEGSTTYLFKVNNIKGDWYSKVCTITQDECTNLWFQPESDPDKNAVIQPNVTGDYIFTINLGNGKVELSLEYPLSVGDYRLSYYDAKTGFHPGHYIKKRNEDRLDTVSFFIHIENNPQIRLESCTEIDPKTSTATWDEVRTYYVLKTSGADPTSAQLPDKRKSDAVLYTGEGCGIETSGVYNFILEQSGNDAELATVLTHAYVGDYYIRTDAADGGWDAFRQAGNKMTYSSYADKNQDFDHYFCKWITQGTNIKFVIANEYSLCISDTLNGDDIVGNTGEHIGYLPADANVRFGWDGKTNEVSRAYISGSAKAVDRFLVLTGNEYLLDIEGNAFPNGTGDRTGLKANEEIFDDMGNWLYQLDVKANTQTAIKLTAQFNNRVQTFFGDARAAADGEEMIDATTPEYHKVRMIYNFKTNHLLVAWLLDSPQQVNNENVASDVLIIRENHGDANQLQFKQGLNQMAVKTAYATMTFTNTHVNDNSLSQWQRYEYWVSFPFDVKISDVFGFGEYGTDWIMQLYDGAERAEKGNWIDSPTFWKYITNRNYTLKAGVGYVLKLQASKMTDKTAFMYSDKVSLYFPSTPNADGNTIISATPNTQHGIPEHECTIERDNRNIYDSHWNLIGVPGYANIADFNTDASLSPVEYKNKEVSFYYAYNAANNTYQATSAESDFKNMHSYMVQFAGTINWSTKEAIKPAELAARRNSDAEPEKRTLRLEIAQGEEVADQTFVQLQQEGATPEFDMNLDLTKIINSGANIYTLAGDARIQVAGNALPVAETTIPVGVQMATAGEYTFRMPDGTEGMVVELIDYETNTRTNLLLSDYTTTLPTGSFENRFALIVKPDKVATDVEHIGEGVKNSEAAKKYIIDGKLYLQKGGLLYDAQGHIVR